MGPTHKRELHNPAADPASEGKRPTADGLDPHYVLSYRYIDCLELFLSGFRAGSGTAPDFFVAPQAPRAIQLRYVDVVCFQFVFATCIEGECYGSVATVPSIR